MESEKSDSQEMGEKKDTEDAKNSPDEEEDNMMASGNKVLDNLIDGLEKDIITTIYGPAGSGKTNFCLLACIEVANRGKKIIYVDTDGSFSVERLKQLTPEYKEVLSRIIFFRPMNFKDQKSTFENLEKIINEKVGLIVVDSIAMLYRLEIANEKDVYDANRELGAQLTVLSKIARKQKIPVLITNQVYSSVDEKDRVKMVGGNFLKYGSKCLIEILELEDRQKLILRKHRSQPKGKTAFFRITEKGVEELPEEEYSAQEDKKKRF